MKIKYQSPEYVVMEFEPSRRTVKHQYGGKIEYYNISFPYLIFSGYKKFGWDRGQMHVACRKSPILKYDDDLLTLPMPNIHSNGGVCTNTVWGTVKYGVLETLKAKVELFWSNAFTYSLENGYSHSIPRGKYLLETLAKLTKDDPLYWKNYDFKGGQTLFDRYYGIPYDPQYSHFEKK